MIYLPEMGWKWKSSHGLLARTKRDKKSVLYYVGKNSKHDLFTPEINAAVELFESKLRRHIRR